MKHQFLAALAAVLASSCILVWEKDQRVDPPARDAQHAVVQEELEPAADRAQSGARSSRTDGPSALSRAGDGKPVCGLGKQFHAGRRAELMKRAGEELLVFRGLPGPRENLAFTQDKTFWYLTGVESPDAALVLDGKTRREILFLPEQDLRQESWDGELWDAQDAWVKELTGFTEVRENTELVATLEELLAGRKKVGTQLSPAIPLSGSYDSAIPFERAQAEDELDGRVSREKALAAKLAEKLGVEVFDVADTLVAMRWVKTEPEIAAMRRAADAGALAMSEAIRSTRPGIGEWELDAVMSCVQLQNGADGKAYAAIVGSARNSCVLHYTASNRRMGAGEVVLIDYGPELDHYTTDITRTWPVDGRFSERAAELYDAVLAAQKAGIAAAKPGVTLSDVNKACTQVIQERGLQEYIRHGACHWIGMEVHDPGLKDPVVPGCAFTIEPGLYDDEAGIGIRIEDVVVITASGCEVISDLVPKERAEIEALVAKEGVLDWLGSRRE